MTNLPKVPKHLLAYTDRDAFSVEAIKTFHDITARGQPYASVSRALSKRQQTELGELIYAHSVYSRDPSPILEGLWVEGQGDYPMRVMLQDMIAEAVGKLELWIRRLPLFARAYRFSSVIHDRPSQRGRNENNYG